MIDAPLPLSQAFPTRSYPYRKRYGGIESAIPIPAMPAGGVYAFRVGVDRMPVAIADAALAGHGDPFAQAVLVPGHRPLTTRAVLALLADVAGTTASFVVSDGAQIPYRDAPGLVRDTRFVIACKSAAGWDVFVSTAAPFDDEDIFLQVLAWDGVAGTFHFYERRGGSWFWAGESNDALRPDTRGRGPFDSHVNGGMVMKELKAPWLHWHSLAQTITSDAFAPGDPVLATDLFMNRRGGDELERIVRGAIDRWTRARLDRALDAQGRIVHPDWLMRQVLSATSVNIVAAEQTFAGAGDAVLSIPITLFVDADALLNVIGIDPGDAGVPTVTRARYAAAAARTGLHLASGDFRIEGDTFFAWPVPERAFEDVTILDHMIRRRWVSRRVAAALLMVDFSNPVGSPAREALLAQVPTDPVTPAELEAALAGMTGVPDLALPDDAWEAEYGRRIGAMLHAVQARIDTDDGLDAMLVLADARRRAFRRRKLSEFDLTLPRSNVADDGPNARLEPDGRVILDTAAMERPA